MSGTLSIDTLQNGAGASVPVTTVINGSAKAWVNWNGAASGTSINKSFNVSSVTKSTQGVWVINYTTSMPSATYSVVTGSNWGPSSSPLHFLINDLTANYCSMYCAVGTGASNDIGTSMCVTVFA